MTENESARRKFLKLFGLSVGASMLSTNVFADSIAGKEIFRLNPRQQEFMARYEKWMDEFIEVIRIKKVSPDNPENKMKMMALTKRAEKFKPEINEFMKDKTFSLIYKRSIERMSKEI